MTHHDITVTNCCVLLCDAKATVAMTTPLVGVTNTQTDMGYRQDLQQPSDAINTYKTVKEL